MDSSELVDVLAARWKAICPSHESSQFTNKRAACGCGARLGKATVPTFPAVMARLSFQRAVGNSSTGSPWDFAFKISEQKKQIANLPFASQSVACRIS